jgi:ribosomal-protein-alanine N-acetyltransferase
MSTPIIETERLRLRSFEIEDAEPLHQILAGKDMLRYFPSPGPPDLARVQRLISRQIDHWEEYGYGWWAVEDLQTQQLLGWNGLQYLPETDEIEIGYLLAQPYWGKGLATEGAKVGINFAFDQLLIPIIIGIVHPDNIASQRVLEKIGLQFEQEAEYFGMACYKYVVENPAR